MSPLGRSLFCQASLLFYLHTKNISGIYIYFAVYYERKVLNEKGNRKIPRNFCEHIVSSQKLRAMFELSQWKGMIKYVFNKVIIKCLVSNRVKPPFSANEAGVFTNKTTTTSPRYDAYHLPIIFFGFFRKK